MTPRFFSDDDRRQDGPIYIPPATCVGSFVMTVAVLLRGLTDAWFGPSPERDDS